MRLELKISWYVKDFLDNLPKELRAKCAKQLKLFEEYGFFLTDADLKKISKDLWELRTKNTRILMGKVKESIWAVHAFYQKTNKIPKKEIELASKRLERLRNE